MKNSSRGNYRILYRDLNSEELYNHFRIVKEQSQLLEAEGLEHQKALKAVREMARVHFADLEPDGFLEDKKAWKGHRWTALYQQWGDYLNDRDQSDPVNTEPELINKVTEREVEKKKETAQSINLIRKYLSARFVLRTAAALLLFVTGYLVSEMRAPEQESAQPEPEAESTMGMLVDEDLNIFRQRVLSGNKETNVLYFPNLEETLAVFATEQNPFAIIDERIVRVGDLVAVDDIKGFVTEIQYSRITLVTPNGILQLPFPPHAVMGQETTGKSVVVIYPEQGNLLRILRGFCLINKWELVGSPNNHTISGKFESVDAFMVGARYLGVKFDQGTVILPEAGKHRAYISFDGLWYEPKGTLSRLVGLYENHLSKPVRLETQFSDQIWVINHGLQFEEFCDFFNLETEQRGEYLIVKGGNDENGKNYN